MQEINLNQSLLWRALFKDTTIIMYLEEDNIWYLWRYNVMYLGEDNMGYLGRYPRGINYVMCPQGGHNVLRR
jgi:hypothetical protein